MSELFAPASIGVALAEAYVLFEEGDHARAQARLDKLIAFLSKARLRAFLPEPYHLKARVFIAQGKQAEARLELEQARAAAEDLGSRWTLWQILTTRSELEELAADEESAERARVQAREQVEFIAAHSKADLRLTFLDLPEVKRVMRDG